LLVNNHNFIRVLGLQNSRRIYIALASVSLRPWDHAISHLPDDFTLARSVASGQRHCLLLVRDKRIRASAFALTCDDPANPIATMPYHDFPPALPNQPRRLPAIVFLSECRYSDPSSAAPPAVDLLYKLTANPPILHGS